MTRPGTYGVYASEHIRRLLAGERGKPPAAFLRHCVGGIGVVMMSVVEVVRAGRVRQRVVRS